MPIAIERAGAKQGANYERAVRIIDGDPQGFSLTAKPVSENDGTIVIEGHTSSEGTDAYNLNLSERRAQAVVADLVKRGITASRIGAAGIGESRPIATNNDENGRSLNRRVEVKCQ